MPGGVVINRPQRWDNPFAPDMPDADVDRISTAFELSESKQRPVACLMGAEYA